MATKAPAQGPAARRPRIGWAALLALVLGLGATVLIFFFALVNVHDSERSLLRERTSQTFGVIETVVQQVEAIVAAGTAAARYTSGDPAAFRQAIGTRVVTSLVSNLLLVRVRPDGVRVLAGAGRSPPLLLAKLTPAERAKLLRIARSGSGLRSLSRGAPPTGRVVSFASSVAPGGDLALYGEVTATGAQAQAGGVAPSDLRYAIYLGTSPRPDRLLLSSADGTPRGDDVVTNQIPIGEEQLFVALGPRDRLVGGFAEAAPWVMLGIGVFGSLALAVLVEAGRRRRDEALRLVSVLERRTADLDEALAEQRRAEREARAAAEQLRHAQRMEAIGRLAGGVAHDFNNLLTAIIGGTRLLLRSTRPGDPARAGLEDIERAADRAASLTRQLLAFGRQQVLQPTVVDLNRVVGETGTILRHLVRADIRVETALDPALPPVEADASQLEQVIVNLVVNAADAIEGGGTVTIATGAVCVTEAESARRPPGLYALLAVSDDGAGMDPETRERVFEPFFTTKELGRGTGLGLATVYGIVEQSGGSIELESEPGRGTTFRVYLPAVDKEVDEPPPPPSGAGSTDGTETILVAEDDEMVRTLVRVTLEDSGYRVLEASSGEAALELCARHDGPVHVLLTDMVMPGMGGRALAERLAAARPELRVLYVSGYAEADVLDPVGPDAKTAFVQKPFTPDDLVHEVRSLIDREPVAAPES